jgi:two-component sensor histidine kinase
LQGDHREFYTHIKTSVNRLDNIISDLSKIIDIRHDIFHIRQKINLDEVVKEILNGLKKDIDDHSVIIKTDFSKCPEIYSVRPMVHSILYNLISNAIKYRSPSRIPEISISSDINKKYLLRVSDNGLGIDLENNQRDLFKLYKRFHFHTEGKGLGLYLVKLQAESLGGRVDVSSELNRNTTFTVLLGQPNNVQQQVLYQKPCAKIYFDATINATGIEWHGPVSSEQYRAVFHKCLEFVKVYGTPNYIADLTDQGHISRDDQQWMFREILPESAAYGLRNIAAILPAKGEGLIKEYMNGVVGIVSRFGIKQEHFLHLEDAIEWIKSENRKNTAQKP